MQAMADGPIGWEPPEVLDTTWLIAYAGTKDEDIPDLEGQVIEEAFVVKRADKWTSKFFVLDQRHQEREYRFYNELAVISAHAEQAASKVHVKMFDWKEPEPEKILTFAEAQQQRRVKSLGKAEKPKEVVLVDARPGVIPCLAELKETGVDGCYEVMRPRVSIHCSPNSRAALIGVLHRTTLIRGLAFAAADGEPWLLLHEDSQEDIQVQREAGVFVPLSAKGIGCDDFLKRVAGPPRPGRNEWRASEVEKEANLMAQKKPPAEFYRWKRFVERVQAKALRLPKVYGSSWKGPPETYLMCLERLGLPDWTGFDPRIGCTPEQAAGAIAALAGFHNAFGDSRKLAGLSWLPTMPVQAYTGHNETIYRNCFNTHRDFLQDCVSPRAFLVLEKFRDHYTRIANILSTPPLTLLHGNYQPGCLRFSTQSSPPKVAAYDWQWVCLGHGAFDFAMFLGTCAPPQVRQEIDPELMIRYMLTRGQSGREAREAFKIEIRAGLLLAFAFYLMQIATKLGTGDKEECRDGIVWFAAAIDDWDCANSIGGVAVRKPKVTTGKKKAKRSKKSKSPDSKGRSKSPDKNGSKSPGPKGAKKNANGAGSLDVLGKRASAFFGPTFHDQPVLAEHDGLTMKEREHKLHPDADVAWKDDFRKGKGYGKGTAKKK